MTDEIKGLDPESRESAYGTWPGGAEVVVTDRGSHVEIALRSDCGSKLIWLDRDRARFYFHSLRQMIGEP